MKKLLFVFWLFAVSAHAQLPSPPKDALLQPHDDQKDWVGRFWDFVFGRFFRAFNRVFDSLSSGYARTVRWMLRRLALPVLVYLALIALTGFGFNCITRVSSTTAAVSSSIFASNDICISFGG